jgi:polysaccharide biosynthesis/export protein
MLFGRLSLARGRAALVLCFLSLSFSAISAMAQTSTPPPNGLPPAEPLAQAARGTSPSSVSPVKIETGNVSAALLIARELSPQLKLGAGDLLEVSVYNVPELSTKARVGTSGDVYLPLIDYVHVGDLTVEEAQNLIQKRLEDGGFVRNAHVTIFLDESPSQGVTILGEVSRPGIYPALGNRKLYDMLSAAGGFTAAAGRNISIVREENPSTPIRVNLPRNLADDLQDNIEIMPGDTITVPRAPIVYVVGEVARPAGLLIDNGSLTVLQALALTGGASHTAKMGGTCIIRKGPNGVTETRVPLKKMLEAKAPDITLQADDILFVPLSGARVAASKGFDAAISAATGLAIVAVHP